MKIDSTKAGDFLKKILLVLFTCVGLTACKVDTPDGLIPTKFFNYAKNAEGTFHLNLYGRRNKPVQGTANLTFDGRKPILTFDGQAAESLDSCGAKLGNLLNVSDNGVGITATFSVHPGACGIAKTLIVYITSRGCYSTKESLWRKSYLFYASTRVFLGDADFGPGDYDPASDNPEYATSSMLYEATNDSYRLDAPPPKGDYYCRPQP